MKISAIKPKAAENNNNCSQSRRKEEKQQRDEKRRLHAHTHVPGSKRERARESEREN